MKTKTIIVSRHAGLVEWLSRQGVTGEVVTHATPEAIKGAHVVGALPPHLAAECEVLTTVSMEVPPELRGKELTVEQMEEFGARLESFEVRRVKTPK